MADIIKIDNGDTFEGSWEQLEDCYGINRDTLDGFCNRSDMKYQILENPIVIIDNGKVFEGTLEELEEQMGLDAYDIGIYCRANNHSWVIKENPLISVDNFTVNDLSDFERQTSAEFESALEKLEYNYTVTLEKVYKAERAKVFLWFNKKYPKRKLKWVDGMGTCMWVLDDEILYFPDVSDVKVVDLDDYTDGRKWKKLLPLLDFYRKIQDSSGRVNPYPVAIGDYSNY